VANVGQLPQDISRSQKKEDADRAVCDYISGMSDRYAVSVYESIFVPRSWGM
jgi:dGTPase